MATVEERLSRLEGGYEHMATKGDIAELKAELSGAIADVRVEVAELRANLSESIGGVKAEIRLLKWGMGLIVLLNAGVLAALIRLLAS